VPGSGSLRSIVESRLSKRGRTEVDIRTNSLIVTDLPEYVQVIEDMIGKLDRPEPQVEIEARIVIANRNFLRDVGTELEGLAAEGRRASRDNAGQFAAVGLRRKPALGRIRARRAKTNLLGNNSSACSLIPRFAPGLQHRVDLIPAQLERAFSRWLCQRPRRRVRFEQLPARESITDSDSRDS
jgi:type II secretory pathway component HofQ